MPAGKPVLWCPVMGSIPRSEEAEGQNMTKPLLVLEDITRRRRLFRVFGVTWWATRYAWMSPLCWVGLGLAMALADRRQAGAAVGKIPSLK